MVAEEPLPEESEIHLLIEFPNESEPVSLAGVVSHTVVLEDEDVPGMGILFRFENGDRESLAKTIDALEKSFLEGALADDLLL